MQMIWALLLDSFVKENKFHFCESQKKIFKPFNNGFEIKSIKTKRSFATENRRHVFQGLDKHQLEKMVAFLASYSPSKALDTH